MSGTSVLADVHGNLTPPHVSPITVALELATTRKLPLRTNTHSMLSVKEGKGGRSQPVHAVELLAERPRGGLQVQEEEDEDDGEARQGQVQV